MYRFLLSCYRALDRAVAALLPDSMTHHFRASSLRIARRLYPEKIVAKSVGELVAMSSVNSWSPPSLPDAQLDFGLNLGLNDDSPDVAFGIGLARRF